MDFLPLEIEKIILDYVKQLELIDKVKRLNQEFKDTYKYDFCDVLEKSVLVKNNYKIAEYLKLKNSLIITSGILSFINNILTDYSITSIKSLN